MKKNSIEECKTFVEILQYQAEHFPQKTSFTYLESGGGHETPITYYELDKRAKKIAAILQTKNMQGERALLLYPPGLDYIAGFFGCLYAGVIAVPVYPPDPTRLQRFLPRLQAIINDSQAKVALTTGTIHTMFRLLHLQTRAAKVPVVGGMINKLTLKKFQNISDNGLSPIQWIDTDKYDKLQTCDWKEPQMNQDSVAYLQYTSGSTGTPRGVIITHKNLIFNSRMIKTGFGMTNDFHGVIWLPIYHDMGLIGGILQPIYLGFNTYLMSPIEFLKRPLLWLSTISQIKDVPVVSGGPNFAYDLCTRRTTPEKSANFDLSNWKVAFSGAEPVRKSTIEEFSKAFQSAGFDKSAFYPCYGLAEATLIVSGGFQSEEPKYLTIDKKKLESGTAEQTNNHDGSLEFVGCGREILNEKILIVNPESKKICSETKIGEIWVQNPSIAEGYWQNDEETQKTFKAFTVDTKEGPFLRTGDLGFLKDGELYITGRLKDLIIINGRNHYPQDIEVTVENSHSIFRPGCVAAFSIEKNNLERLVVIQEVRTKNRSDWKDIALAVRQSVSEVHELQIYSLVFIEPRTIFKTSSGKIQRRATKKAYLNKQLNVIYEWNIDFEHPDILPEAKPKENAEFSFSIDTFKQLEPFQQFEILVQQIKTTVSEVLKVSKTEINKSVPITSFGLDSIMAIELKHSIESLIRVDLPISSLLEGPSIHELCQIIMEKFNENDDKKTTPAATFSSKKSEFSVSEGQKALWFQHQLAPLSIFNLSYAVRIKSKIDIKVFKDCLKVLVQRHPTLRTNFKYENETLIQVIRENVQSVLYEIDALNLSEDQLKKRIEDESIRSFNLENEPLIRLFLFKRSQDEQILLLVCHHIISDLWSLAVLMYELNQLYATEAKISLPHLKYSYWDYVEEQKEMLQSDVGKAHLQYWEKQLHGELPILNFPTDRMRPAVQTYLGKTASLNLDSNLCKELNQVCEKYKVTLYTLLLASINVLFHRYTGQNDIILGSPMSGRKDSKFASVFGYFVNPVAIRTKLNGHESFITLLQKVNQTVLEAMDHQDYPFNQIVKKLHPKREPSHTPIFQHMFVYQKAYLMHETGMSGMAVAEEGGTMKLGDMTLESNPIENRVVPFDITILMAELEGGLGISLQYNSDLFYRETIVRFLKHLRNLLQSIVQAPFKRITDLSIFDQNEFESYVYTWNQTYRELPSPSCLSELFEQRVKQTPQKLAVVFKNEQLTYEELNQKANQLAWKLKDLGIGPDKIVGIGTDRSIDMIVGILAILKAGGAYLPLDPHYPKARLSFMFQDSKLKLLLTQKNLTARLPENSVNRLYFDSIASVYGALENPACHIEPQNLAYVIYTSGSTGKPKGVMVTQAGLLNLTLAQIKDFNINSETRLLQFASLSFDAAASEIFTTLIAGATLFLVENNILLSGWELVQFIQENKITTSTFPPSVLRVLPGDAATSLQTVVSAGEACAKDIAKIWTKGKNFINAYGPTETTICATSYHIDGMLDHLQIPIGKPISNVQVYVMNHSMHLVPIGVPGELFIGGAGIARGYLFRPELTAEKFLPDPFSKTKGARIYKTGDLVRYLADGNIEFIGRIDQQVKLRGFRIELGEIEAVIKTLDDVKEAVTIASADRLIAYIIPISSAHLNSEEIKFELRKKLPEYMVPSTFIELNEFPLNANGKIDYKSLPSPLKMSNVLAEAESEIERKLVQIWQEILKINHVGIHDNFFDLGGHSLTIIQAQNRIKEVFNKEIEVLDMFKYPTIDTFAKFLDNGSNGNDIVKKSIDRAHKQMQAVKMRKSQLKVSGKLSSK